MTVQFYADPAAVGAANGTSWTDAWTTMAAAMTGMAAYNGGTMADAYVLNMRGVFSQSGRFDTGTSFVGNSASNTITLDGGAWIGTAGVRGAENTYLHNTSTADEGFLIRENYVRLKRFRLKADGTGATRSSTRLFVSAHKEFYAEDLLLENQPTIEGDSVGTTRTFANCVIDRHDASNPNISISAGSAGAISTNNFINCIINFTRLVVPNYTTTNFINTVYQCSLAISKAATSCVINGDGSTFYANEAATLDSGTGAIHSTGNIRATWFTDEVNGDFTYAAAGITALAGFGIGPASNALVPTVSIDGNTRSGTTCDIGPYQQASGGTFNPSWALNSNMVLKR